MGCAVHTTTWRGFTSVATVGSGATVSGAFSSGLCDRATAWTRMVAAGHGMSNTVSRTATLPSIRVHNDRAVRERRLF